MSTNENAKALPKGTGVRLAVQAAFIPAYAGMFLLIATAVRYLWLPSLPDLTYVDAIGIMAAVAAWKLTRIVAAALGDAIVGAKDGESK